MATDVDRLRTGLEAYRESLTRHLNRLGDDFESVRTAWLALDREYEGRAAEEFRQHWGVTAAWFDQYMNSVRNMLAMLRERSEHLRGL